MPGSKIDTSQMEGINLGMAVGAAGLSGIAALVEELRSTIGDEACSRIKQVMLARLAEFPLSPAVRSAAAKDVETIQS